MTSISDEAFLRRLPPPLDHLRRGGADRPVDDSADQTVRMRLNVAIGPSSDHGEIAASLARVVLAKEPLIAITGAAGSGKTRLLDRVVPLLTFPEIRIVRIGSAGQHPFDGRRLLQGVIEGLGGDPAADPVGQLVAALNRLRTRASHLVLMVDDAQALVDDAFDCLGLITSLAQAEAVFLQIILAGRQQMWKLMPLEGALAPTKVVTRFWLDQQSAAAADENTFFDELFDRGPWPGPSDPPGSPGKAAGGGRSRKTVTRSARRRRYGFTVSKVLAAAALGVVGAAGVWYVTQMADRPNGPHAFAGTNDVAAQSTVAPAVSLASTELTPPRSDTAAATPFPGSDSSTSTAEMLPRDNKLIAYKSMNMAPADAVARPVAPEAPPAALAGASDTGAMPPVVPRPEVISPATAPQVLLSQPREPKIVWAGTIPPTEALRTREPDTPRAEVSSQPASATAGMAMPPAPDLIEALRARGDELLATGDIMSARLMFERAAVGGSSRAAISAGMTYDPNFLALLGAQGIPANVATAASWYRQAAASGEKAAAGLLARLGPVPRSR